MHIHWWYLYIGLAVRMINISLSIPLTKKGGGGREEMKVWEEEGNERKRAKFEIKKEVTSPEVSPDCSSS